MVKQVLFIAAFIVSINASAQIALLDNIGQTDLQRDKQLLKGEFSNQSFLLRSNQDYKKNEAQPLKPIGKGIFWDGLTVKYTIQNNSNLPMGFNEGSLYPAIGFQSRASIGTRLVWKNVELNLNPEFVTAKNTNPPVFMGNTEDGNFWARYYLLIQNNIDYYTQMGRKPLSTFFPGQSSITYHYKKLAGGFSTENQWWGPGVRNSLLMTNEAAGFNHFFIKTNEPILTPVGSFEGRAILGRLESPSMPTIEDSLMATIWEDGMARKNKSARHIEGFSIAWQPKWLPNVYLGYQFTTQSYVLNKNLIGDKNGLLSDERPKQQMGSISIRVALPKDHAEIYAEIGQPNKAASPWGFFGDSAKTGFVIGAKKLFNVGRKGSYFKLFVEFTQLQLMNPALVVNTKEPFGGPLVNSWYSSTQVRQGYTHDGKMLGASIGPGSNSQTIGLSWHKGNNKIGVFFERVATNNDFYTYEYFGSAYDNRYFIYMNKGLEAQVQINTHFLFAVSAMQTNALNYKWVRIDQPNVEWSEPSSLSDKSNLLLNASLKFNLHGSR